MTNQEAFDIVARHLLTQKKRSRIEADPDRWACAYRGDCGTKCAIGVLIPDEDYLPEMEKMGVKHIAHNYHLSCLEGLNLEFLEMLQIVHDKIDVKCWKDNLAMTARLYKLDASVLEEFP